MDPLFVGSCSFDCARFDAVVEETCDLTLQLLESYVVRPQDSFALTSLLKFQFAGLAAEVEAMTEHDRYVLSNLSKMCRSYSPSAGYVGTYESIFRSRAETIRRMAVEERLHHAIQGEKVGLEEPFESLSLIENLLTRLGSIPFRPAVTVEGLSHVMTLAIGLRGPMISWTCAPLLN